MFPLFYRVIKINDICQKNRMELYPLKFEPILKERIWGGEKLHRLLGKKRIGSQVGESWEIADVGEEVSMVANGHLQGISLRELLRTKGKEILGAKVQERFGAHFPLLIKYIDARQDLSIQLHPGDSLARERHGSMGKTEMWYVMQADPGSRLIVGFKEGVDKQIYLQHLHEKKLVEILNMETVGPGDACYIPAGRIHAIGAGVLLAEIQQASDLTYRVFDWDRTDSEGRRRQLHTEEALEAMDFQAVISCKTEYSKTLNRESQIVVSKYFTTNLIVLDSHKDMDHSKLDSFVIYMCVSGAGARFSGKGFSVDLRYGETLLIPSCMREFRIQPEDRVELLQVYIP